MLKTLQATAGPDAHNPGAYCLPQAAVPFLVPFPWKLVQTPTLMVHLIEFFTPGFGIHTEKLHTIERIRRPDMTRLEIEITAEDPDAYTGPWTATIHASLAPDHEILEFVCSENNKDATTFGGLGWKGRP